MAAVLPYQPHQQQAQLQAQSPQSTQLAGGGGNDLYAAFRRYVTTGSNATDASEAEVKAAYDAETAAPGGQLALAALVATSDLEKYHWQQDASTDGSITFQSMKVSFALNSAQIGRSSSGDASGGFAPTGALLSGTLYYDDLNSLQGSQSVVLTWNQGVFYIDFYTSQNVEGTKPVARFKQLAAPFYFNGAKQGNAKWTLA